MTPLAELIQQGSAHAWLFIPSAILLGALHGLEPGHSKTMMAAFIIAVRGTVRQAILLGLSATLSHTAVVWAVAMAGLYLGEKWASPSNEPYFQLASAAVILLVACWMLWRTWKDQKADGHEHRHHDEVHEIDTGHGMMKLEIFEEGVPPRWRIRFAGHGFHAQDVSVTTTRPDGTKQAFTFVTKKGFLESVDEIPEPHAFNARVSLSHGNHAHDYDVTFTEHAHHHADALDVAEEDMDAHQRAHANDIRNRFTGRSVTTGQIILFGLTGGLIPCPAAITVLLLCLQLKQISLGVVLVLCFSIGLALTMVSAGVIAAIGAKHAGNRWPWFNTLAKRAPYASSLLIILVGLYMAYHGWILLQ